MTGLFVAALAALAALGFLLWRLLVLWSSPPIKEPEG